MKIVLTLVLVAMSFYSSLPSAKDIFDPKVHTGLVTDSRARAIGDIVTILVFESSSASNAAGLSADRGTSLRLGVAASNNDSKTGKLELNDESNSRGKVQREGKLLATLSVTVVDLLPNGLLLVSGDQRIAINNEVTQIKLSGKLRTTDISDANTVLSTRLADAQIQYSGEGIVSDRAKPGILAKILNWLGL
jgi:flagellar L-ring protein FlgH